MQDGIVGPVGKWLVHEFEHQAGTKEKKYQYSSHAAKPPGQGEPEGALRNNPGPEMQQQAAEIFPLAFLLFCRFMGTRKN